MYSRPVLDEIHCVHPKASVGGHCCSTANRYVPFQEGMTKHRAPSSHIEDRYDTEDNDGVSSHCCVLFCVLLILRLA